MSEVIDVEIGAHTGAKNEFLHTVYAPFYGAPSVYALISRMAARIAYRITADMYKYLLSHINRKQNNNSEHEFWYKAEEHQPGVLEPG